MSWLYVMANNKLIKNPNSYYDFFLCADLKLQFKNANVPLNLIFTSVLILVKAALTKNP